MLFPNQNKTCKSKAKADAVLENVVVTLSVLTEYFDQNNFQGNPIKA